jgi:nucleotide-binding universal stress UspA family protein
VAVAIPLWRTARFEPMLPRGLGGVGAAISLVYISFFGYQLIANSAEEVRDAPRTVPRAMILSLAIAAVCYLVVAVVAVAAVDWQALAGTDAPLVLMASRAVGNWGAWLIGAGAILASAAALNSTLVSQGRQVYAMGRDRLLPELVGRLTARSKVPAVAMVSASLVVVGVLALADLAFIAKAANFALLFSMLPVSVALDRLHRDQPEPVPRWRRVVPWAALAANLGLLLTLDWQSLLFGGSVVGAGAVVFLSYSYSAEKRGRAGFSVDLARDRHPARLRRGERILVPMANPRTQESLFSISEALMPPDGGEIVVLSVVQAEPDEDPRKVLRRITGSHEAVHVLQRVRELATRRGVTFKPVVRAATTLAKGIAHAALRQRCRLIVMGWASQDDGSPSKLLDEVVSEARTDVVFLQLTSDVEPQRIGVALGARGNLPLMVRVASTLAEQYGGEVIYLNVLPEYYGPEHHEHARQVHAEAIGRHTSLVPYRTELLQSDNPLGALVERSEELDLLVIGSARAGPYAQEAVGSFSAMVAEQARCSVVIVRSSPSMGRLRRPSALEALRDLGAGLRSWRDRGDDEVEAVVGLEATAEREQSDASSGHASSGDTSAGDPSSGDPSSDDPQSDDPNSGDR